MKQHKYIKKPSFKGKDFFIGIDVHKKTWYISIRHNGLLIKAFAMDPIPEILVNFLNKNYPCANFFVAYETGRFGFWIYRKFKKLGINCMVVNPADIPSTHKEKDKKSDKIDSHKLARELENNNLNPIYVPPPEAQHLRSLVRLYLNYTKNITRTKNQIKSFLDYNGITLPKHTSSWSNNFIKYLYSITIDNGPGDRTLYSLLDTLRFFRKEQNNILKQIRKFINNSYFKKNFDLIRTVPGVGFKIGFIILSEIIDMKRFKNFDQLKSYVGLTPSVYSSGDTYYEHGLTYRKNSRLKYALIEASWVAIRKDPALLESYNKLITRMKKQQAIIRIAKKLLSRIRYVWLNKQPYVTGIVE